MKKSKKNEMLYPKTENGIYLYEYPIINGIKQYVQVRGTDRKNPLILFIHGGPGASIAGLCHIMQTGWEKEFTVANWDQRNTCKTYFANKEKASEIAKTGTMDDYLRDIDGVITYLHTVYDFEKLILIGFSWGSAIGSEYAKRYPEKLLCYVGTGQFISYRDGVITVCEKMLEFVPDNSPDGKKIRHIIADFPEKPVWNKELMKLMGCYPALTAKYIAKHAKRVPLRKIISSPFMNLKEKKASLLPNYTMFEKSFETMLNYNFRSNLSFDVPVLFIYGEEENICPSRLLSECYDQATQQSIIIKIIPNASHCCFFDQPDIFLSTVSSFVRNII